MQRAQLLHEDLAGAERQGRIGGEHIEELDAGPDQLLVGERHQLIELILQRLIGAFLHAVEAAFDQDGEGLELAGLVAERAVGVEAAARPRLLGRLDGELVHLAHMLLERVHEVADLGRCVGFAARHRLDSYDVRLGGEQSMFRTRGPLMLRPARHAAY